MQLVIGALDHNLLFITELKKQIKWKDITKLFLLKNQLLLLMNLVLF